MQLKANLNVKANKPRTAMKNKPGGGQGLIYQYLVGKPYFIIVSSRKDGFFSQQENMIHIPHSAMDKE